MKIQPRTNRSWTTLEEPQWATPLLSSPRYHIVANCVTTQALFANDEKYQMQIIWNRFRGLTMLSEISVEIFATTPTLLASNKKMREMISGDSEHLWRIHNQESKVRPLEDQLSCLWQTAPWLIKKAKTIHRFFKMNFATAHGCISDEWEPSFYNISL